MPIFLRRAKHFFPELAKHYDMLDKSILLKTIKFPNTIGQDEDENKFLEELQTRLPKPAYVGDRGYKDEEEDDLNSTRSRGATNE